MPAVRRALTIEGRRVEANRGIVNARRNIFGYLAAVASVAVVTAVLVPFRQEVNPTSTSLIFLLAVLAQAMLFGSRPALVTSLLAALCFNFFFLPPYYTLTIDKPQDWAALIAFLVVAIAVGQLSARARHRAQVAEGLYADLQEAFEAAAEAEALKRSERLKSALLDAVTHDLRTPLTSIKAATTMLIEDQSAIHKTLDPDGRADLLSVINEETDRLNSFVESMVELARLEAGGIEFRTASITARDLIAAAMERAAELLRDREVSVEIGDPSLSVKADANALTEVFYNLFENAVKYSPAASPIAVAATVTDGVVRFSVEDQGPGIAPEERERVFEKFYRGNSTVRGFGLGLSIVRGIVEAHGGTIRVEDGAIGARFVLEIPAAS